MLREDEGRRAIPAWTEDQFPTKALSPQKIVINPNITPPFYFESSFIPKDFSQNEILTWLSVRFFDHLPLKSVRHYPRGAAVILGLFAYSIIIILFAGLFIVVYIQTMKEQFVSLDVNAGHCTEVMRPLSGQYFASSTGYWQGSKAFSFTDASYLFSFSGYTGSNDRFKKDLLKFYNDNVLSLGQIARTSPLVYNLVVWMSYSGTFSSVLNGINREQVFSFTGSTMAVYNRQYTGAQITFISYTVLLIIICRINSCVTKQCEF